MRIVNRAVFLALPAGTLYSKYEPCVFEGFNIKLASTPYDDWRYLNLGPGYLDREVIERDGCFEDDEDTQFAVFDEADVLVLTQRLVNLLPGYALVKT